MSTQTAVYATTEDSQDEPHYVLPDGVTVLPKWEGHIYAPGCWKETNVQQEDV